MTMVPFPHLINPYEGSSAEERIWFATQRCEIKGLHDAHAKVARYRPSFFFPLKFASTMEELRETQQWLAKGLE